MISTYIMPYISAAAADVCLVAFHFFRHSPHELAARVNLQHLRPSQRAAPVKRLEGLFSR